MPEARLARPETKSAPPWNPESTLALLGVMPYNRTYVWGICLTQVVVSGGDEFVQRMRIGLHRLFEKPVEEQPAAGAGSAVEPEREFVEVVVEMRGGLAVVQRAGEPPFQQ